MDISRKSIIREAIDRCYAEMYAKAQPSADLNKLLEGKQNGTVIDTDENPIYQRYYLSQAEFDYILDKYKKAYGFEEHWRPDVDLLIKDLKKGGLKDIYVEDENGISHREAEKTPALESIVGKENADKVFEVMEDIRDFYRFDRIEMEFSCAIALGGTPTADKKTVIEYWKSQGVDIEIEDRDPDTFWYRDEYGDQWEQVLEEEKMLDNPKIEDNGSEV